MAESYAHRIDAVNANCIGNSCISHRMPDWSKMHLRLKWARKRAGFSSAAEAARALGVPEPTYSGHENGSRGFADDVERYASRFRVSLSWLMTGAGSPDNRLQERFAALPPDAQTQLLDFLAFLESRKP
jgi:transcriptional regulator with XRE-family HTH domain